MTRSCALTGVGRLGLGPQRGGMSASRVFPVTHRVRDVVLCPGAATFGRFPAMLQTSRPQSAVVKAVGASTVPTTLTAAENGGLEGLVWRHDFGEQFSIGDVIGEGQQGQVLNVVKHGTGDRLAVKVVARNAGMRDTSEAEERKLRSEATFHQRLQGCPAVAKLWGAYEDDEYVYIVMERLDSGNVEEKLQELGHFSEPEAAELMKGVLEFLAYSHDNGICYGDLKPANFMLGKRPDQSYSSCKAGRLQGLTVKAIDFGCCQKVVPGVPFRRRSGSPFYMAPEIFLGRYGMEADLWSAGVMLYQLLSGRMPFARYDDDGEIVELGLQLGYSFEGEPWDSVSSEAKDLIEKLLVRAPIKRISATQAVNHTWFWKVDHSCEEHHMPQEMSSIVTAPGSVSVTQPVATPL